MGSNGCWNSDMLLGAMPTINAAAKDWWVRYQNLTQGPDGLKTQLHFGEVPLCFKADKIKDSSKKGIWDSEFESGNHTVRLMVSLQLQGTGPSIK
jgi:hypothetical protein